MNTVFRDADTAERARERLERVAGIDLKGFFEVGFVGNPAPDTALVNLERWLKATSSASLYMQQVAGLPKLGSLLLQILGASQPIADSLIQNPELASLILEPGMRQAKVDREEILREGRQLVAASTSHSHTLDRLRFLKQKWNLLIVLNDLTDAWPQEQVWEALSVLADSLVVLAVEAVWAARSAAGECPITVIAFGKLAGNEVNYSSDIDLLYVASDDCGEELTKICEALTRAMSDRMGRGALYRVDLRLRPYGAAGPICPTMTAVEAYYARHAEPWEVQALVRTRPIVGPEANRWNAMRAATCFKPKLTEIALEQMISMRDRIESEAQDDDLKRGRGGIRDVEFLVQILQLLHGRDEPRLQVVNTLDALRRLDDTGYLEHADALSLADSYTFLRKLEHRIQLIADQQTHTIPEEPRVQEAIARLMGCRRWGEVVEDLARHRQTISTLYDAILKPTPTKSDARSEIQRRLDTLGPAALQWIDVLPESDAFFEALRDNQGSLDRVQKVLTEAPKLVPEFKSSVPLTEMLFSGEIEEPIEPASRIKLLKSDAPPRQVAEAFRATYAVLVTQWLFGSLNELESALAELMDALLRHVAARLYAPFDIVALGSLGSRDFGPGSDADLLLLVDNPKLHHEAEIQAQHLLAFFGEIKRLGAPVSVDLRLRPEGGKGLLVRTYDGLRAYDYEGMEMWERFALGSARLISGNPASLEVVQKSAYGLPLTPERLKELTKMKRRIETERVKPQHVRRNVKLGQGGLSDLEWLVHLHEMRYPTALQAGETTNMEDRIRKLGRAGLMNMIEVDALLLARRHLLGLRTRLFLMGQAEDRVPENPDRLDRLAQILGFEDGNAFLADHEQIIDAVRRLYLESLDRLRP